jgi:hypothetical protein
MFNQVLGQSKKAAFCEVPIKNEVVLDLDNPMLIVSQSHAPGSHSNRLAN